MPSDQWDNYLQRIIDPQDKMLFKEAAGAERTSPRAAYISIWLACAESLKRKFKDASPYDNVATRIVGNINDKESKQQAIDTYVLSKAKEYGFISESEFGQLESIYKQRCVYGHPYEKVPLPEQLFAAAATVVEFVLSRPTKLRHGYLDRQVELICSDPTFLDDHLPAVDNHAQTVFSRSSSDLHLWFLQKLWRRATALVNDPSMELFFRRAVWFSTAFLRRSEKKFFNRWDASQDLTHYPFVSYVLCSPDLFPNISEHSQDIVIGNLLTYASSHAAILRTIEELNNAGILTRRQKERVAAIVEEIPLHVVASSGVHQNIYFDRIIEALKSYDWYSQNPAIDVVRNMGPNGIAKLLPAKQSKLGNNVLQAADGKANNAISFLSDIAKGENEWPEAFVEGIIAECLVNDENNFRFKTKHIQKAMNCLRSVPAGPRDSLISHLVSRLKLSKPKGMWAMEEEQQLVVETIKNIINSDPTVFSVLTSLKEAVEQLEIP